MQDVVTCVRHRCTIDELGFKRERHADRHLKPAEEMHRLFAKYPEALARTLEVAAAPPSDWGAVAEPAGAEASVDPEAEAAYKRALEIHTKAFGEENPVTQRTIKALASLYTDWNKPAQAAMYTAKLKPVETKPQAAAGAAAK